VAVANQEHLKRLLQGVAEWNEWRHTTGVTCPDLSGAQLGHKVLIGANLRRVDLRGAGLIGTDLSGADLTDADLRFTNRVDAILNNETILPDGSHWAPSKQLLPSQPGHKPRVFIDIDDIPPGLDFHKILKDEVNKCAVQLALIGPAWIDATDPKTGHRRLDDPDDFVRIEIAAALARGIPVVPVLIERAPMPDIDLLPDDLKKLTDRQAEFIEFRTFDHDVERLIRRLRLNST